MAKVCYPLSTAGPGHQHISLSSKRVIYIICYIPCFHCRPRASANLNPQAPYLTASVLRTRYVQMIVLIGLYISGLAYEVYAIDLLLVGLYISSLAYKVYMQLICSQLYMSS